MLPRHNGNVFEAGSELFAAVEWMCSSGKLTKPFRERSFTPFDSRKEGGQRTQVDDPEGESLDDLRALVKNWAKRHGARTQSRRDLRVTLSELLAELTKPRVDFRATLLYEGLVTEGEYPFEGGYLAVYRITDQASGLEIGRFHFYLEDGASSSQFAPNEANLAKAGKKK